MTEVRQWLDANEERLSALADRIGVPADMVHLSAVLVMGGLTDDQIAGQLRSVRWGGADETRSVNVVLRSLPAIRVAVTQDWWPVGGGQPAGHRVVAHTADCIIEAWGADRVECLKEALSGLVEEFTLLSEAPVTRVLPLNADPGPPEDQLVALLEEVIYDLDVLSVVPVRFHLSLDDEGAVAGDMEVVPVDEAAVVGPAPKAVTYHDLAMVSDERGWRCRVLIDV